MLKPINFRMYCRLPYLGQTVDVVGDAGQQWLCTVNVHKIYIRICTCVVLVSISLSFSHSLSLSRQFLLGQNYTYKILNINGLPPPL